ncbi:MAG: hypothetical protein CME33_25875 [Gimesia sp.]|uniref:hypothetical protein n=2 Tax=Gimesia TaxID=1649453 RepID=UPI000C573E22|nr:hypothetical protein [Gimesia sp.]MAX39985.1 hypothetical protein [Gimesia sp.]
MTEWLRQIFLVNEMDETDRTPKPENQSPPEAHPHSESVEQPSDGTSPESRSQDLENKNSDTSAGTGTDGTVTQERPTPKPSTFRECIVQVSVYLSALILLAFVAMTVYAGYRSAQLIKEIPPCKVNLSGTCSELKLQLLNSPEFTLPTQGQKLSEMIVSEGTGTWQGPLSLEMDQRKPVEVKRIDTKTKSPTATLQVKAAASTRFDLTLPGKTEVKFVSPAGKATRQIQISPFKSVIWTAKFPHSETPKEPGMEIFPSATELVCETDSNKPLTFDLERQVRLYPGKTQHEGDPISVKFQPQKINTAAPQIELFWNATEVTFLDNRRLQISPASITLKDIQLSAFSLDSQPQSDMIGQDNQLLILEPSDLKKTNLSLAIVKLTEKGMHIEISGTAQSCRLATGSGDNQLCPNSLERVRTDSTSQKHVGDYLIAVWWIDSFSENIIFSIVFFCAGVLLTWLGLKPKSE